MADERPEFLFHYTHPLHLSSIVVERALWTTESNISIETPNYGPDVVWALGPDHEFPLDAELPHGLLADKMLARVVFQTPERAVKWLDWEWTAKMDPVWREALLNAAGGEEAAKDWWVVDHPVLARHWAAVEYRDEDGGWIGLTPDTQIVYDVAKK